MIRTKISLTVSYFVMVNVLKFQTLFSNKIHKFLVMISNREEPWSDRFLIRLLKKKSDLGLPRLSRPFRQATSFQNFRTFTIIMKVNAICT